MRIAVVGASGNVGTALLRRLAREGDVEVVGLCRRPPEEPRPPYDRVRWQRVDIGEPGAEKVLAQAFRGTDAVVQLAWLLQPSHDQQALHHTNVPGSGRVFVAAADAGVPHLLYVSSVGAYSPASKSVRTGENWPTGGVAGSHYSRDKAAVERLLDRVAERHPELTITRVRPGLVMQRGAASEVQRYFLGPFAVGPLFRWVRRGRLPVVPLPRRFTLQFVHADDLADAMVRMLRRRAGGAFNIAAEPPLEPADLARLLNARYVPVPETVMRVAASAGWRLRLQPTSPDWVDLAVSAPVMSTERARRELDWRPEHTAWQAVLEMVEGLAEGEGMSSPVLRPRGAESGRVPRP